MQIGLSLSLSSPPRRMAAPEPPAPLLLIVAGQSNARAAGATAAAAPAAYAALADAAIWVAAAGGFGAYVAGGNSDSKGMAGCWGSEAEVIRQLNIAQPGRPVFVIKEAVNGASLAAAGSNSWSPSGGTRLPELAAQVAAARLQIAALGHRQPVELLLWNQGEADAESDGSAAAYKANLLGFLAALRAGVTTGLFIIERIRPYSGDLAGKPYSRTFRIRQAQEEVAASDPTVGIVSLDFDASTFGDLHPGAAWTEGKGLRCFARWAGSHDAHFGAVLDPVPGPLVFAAATGIAPGAVATSAPLAPFGLGCHAPVIVSGGSYRVLNPDDSVWQDWTTLPGTLHPGQKLQLRLIAPATHGATAEMTATVGGISGHWSVATSAAAAREPETAAFLARLTGLGGAAMPEPGADALDAFFVAARTASWGPKLHRLYARLHDATASGIDLVDRTTSLAQIGASDVATWTAAGWSADGNSGTGLSLGVNPAAVTTQNSVALILWYGDATTAGGSDSSFDLQGSDISLRLRQNAAGNLQARMHASGNQTLTGIAAAPGLRVASRTGATATTFYGPEGTAIGSSATASTAPTATALYLFAPVTGSTSARRVMVAGLADGLTAAEVTSLNTALGTLLASFA